MRFLNQNKDCIFGFSIPVASLPYVDWIGANTVPREWRTANLQSLFWCMKAHLAVACKLSGFMQRRMGPSVQICGKSGLPFAEVPCLHQSNLHMKRKLREWRTQKCNPCFGAESPPRSTRLQTTRFHAAPYGTVSANLRKVGTLFRRGTVFAPIQSTYGREATGMENPKMRSLFWFRKRTSQYGPVNYPVSCSAVWDRQCKLRKVGASFRRGTVFAPIQSTYEKEATGMENPKMQSLFWCRKPTSQYAPANYPVSCSAVLDRECKFAESRGFLSPRYRVCTNPIYI